MKATTHPQGGAPTFLELYTPKIVTVLREGYGMAQFHADAVAGLTVAVVALPPSMAIAIASGASPALGLYTAIVGGFLVSLLGGSRFQIGGPAGAFIVLVAATVPFLDSTGANMIESLAHKAEKQNVALWLTGASRDIRRAFLMHGLKKPLVHYAGSIDDALARIRHDLPSDDHGDHDDHDHHDHSGH
jgi:MFS superfamily sulfate permease-like transporter